VTTFAALLFADRGWTQGWLAYTAYAVAFILARVFFSHASDKFGGAKVALFCVLIETAGQALMWLAVRPELALVGALSRVSDSRWSIPASASKRSGGCRHKVAGLRWEPTPPSSTWPRASQARRLGWSRKGPA
jgi:hypothetical protein